MLATPEFYETLRPFARRFEVEDLASAIHLTHAAGAQRIHNHIAAETRTSYNGRCRCMRLLIRNSHFGLPGLIQYTPGRPQATFRGSQQSLKSAVPDPTCLSTTTDRKCYRSLV